MGRDLVGCDVLHEKSGVLILEKYGVIGFYDDLGLVRAQLAVREKSIAAFFVFFSRRYVERFFYKSQVLAWTGLRGFNVVIIDFTHNNCTSSVLV